MTLFLSSDAFKGVKKAQPKCSFTAKMYLQITTNPMLTKSKTPYKIHFWIQIKTSSSILIFSWGGDVFTVVKIYMLGG